MGSSYVVSDVHGHLDELRAVLSDAGLVEGDRWVGGPSGDDSLWVLGDLTDRGPDGIGVLRLVRSLQEQAPERVTMLLGNHEALMLGERLFPDSRFSGVWLVNGGRFTDQEALTDEDVAWLRSLPAMALVGEDLLVHSDTTDYLGWGSSVEQVNATVADLLGGRDVDQLFDVFATLTSRYDYLGPQGPLAARRMLDTFGGSRLVHGHSIIASLTGTPSAQTTEALSYADGLVLDIDGGRYDGGPLLLVRLS
jgi:calcineurin-like phosphoesterase family protein